MQDYLIEDLLIELEKGQQEAFFLVDIKGQIIFCNQKAADLFYYDSPDEIVGLHTKEMVPEDFSTLFPEEITDAHLTKGKYLQRVNRRKDNSLFQTLVKTESVECAGSLFVKVMVKCDESAKDKSIYHSQLEQNIEVLKCQLISELNKNTAKGVQVDQLLAEALMQKGFALTTKDLQLASLIHYHYSSKRIAEKLFISLNSVYMARKRLRKKLNLEPHQSLEQFFYQLKEGI